MRAANEIVKMLEHEGVEYIFGVPGEENLDVMDALLESSIHFIVTRHETNAAFMAGIYGRLTGRPGVCLSTLGPGATNLLTGVANANMDLSPVVAITGQASLKRQHKQSHQYYDLVSIYAPVTKWNASIHTPETIPEVVRKAFRVATKEKPGATHIEIPEDIAGMEMEAREPLQQVEHSLTVATTEEITKATKIMTEAKEAIILIGNGVTRAKAAEQVTALINHFALPVVHTFMGKGAVPWTHPYSLFTAGMVGRDYINCGFDRTDLIITIGFDMAEFPPSRWNPDKNKTILHIDSVEAETDSHYPVKYQVIGNIKENLKLITEKLPEKKNIASWVPQLREDMLNELKSFEYDMSFPVKPQKIIHDLRSVLGEEDIVVSDVGAHKMWLARLYHCYKPNTLLISNGLASMGIAMPGAIGAKLVRPDRKVVAVCGDGGFLMTGADLETAVRLNLPIVILVWRDSGYGLIEWKQQNAFGRSSNIKFGNPDFVTLAKSYGAEGLRIDKTEELIPTLERALSMEKPVVIDCPVDYSENMKLTEKMGEWNCEV